MSDGICKRCYGRTPFHEAWCTSGEKPASLRKPNCPRCAELDIILESRLREIQELNEKLMALETQKEESLTTTKIYSDADKAASQILADHFPQRELTQEEEWKLGIIEKDSNGVDIKFLLALIYRLRQQPERKACNCPSCEESRYAESVGVEIDAECDRKAWLEGIASDAAVKITKSIPSLRVELEALLASGGGTEHFIERIKGLILSCSQEVEGGV